MTPAEFEALSGVSAKSLRQHLRNRWPHEHMSRWVMDQAMIADACATFGVSVRGGGSRPAPTIVQPARPQASASPPPRRSSGLHHELLAAARRSGIPLRAGTSVEWLTGRGHLNRVVQARAPADVLEALAGIHRELGGDSGILGAKRPGTGPTPDLIHEELGCIIEVDEIQHFTTARSTTFSWYPTSIRIGFDLDEYRSLITTWNSQADRAFAHKTAPDFPRPGGRQAQRAYNDALRDLLAPTFTAHPIIRIAVPDRSMRNALERLQRALDSLS